MRERPASRPLAHRFAALLLAPLALLALPAPAANAQAVLPPALVWTPVDLPTAEVPEAALYFEGMAGRILGVDAMTASSLESRGAIRLDLEPGETIYVAMLEDAQRAAFEPPGRVLVRAGHEVVVVTRGEEAPRLTELSERAMRGLRQLMRVDLRPIPTAARAPEPPTAPRVADPLIQEMVDALTQANYSAAWQTIDDFENRYYSAAQNLVATQWMLDQFLAMGLDAEFHLYQQNGTRRNVVATLPGLVDPTKVVYITAHCDATSENTNVCAPGADDNGSGTTAVVEVARVLSQYAFQYTIKFALFNGEEQGLIGSAAYVADIAAAGEDVVACFNADMISYRGTDPAPPDLIIYTNAASQAHATTLSNAIADYLPGMIQPIVHVEALNASDHASFWAYGYEAICSIEDEAWGDDFCPWYHTCNDRIEQYPRDYATFCAKANLAAVATTAMPVNPDGSFLVFGSSQISDDNVGGSNGNGDGDVNPGETIELWVTVRNLGQASATNVHGSLASQNPHATVLQGAANWNDIPPSGEGTNLTAFRVSVAGVALDEEVLTFALAMDADDGSRELPVSLIVVAPALAYRSHVLDDATHGNGNGIPEPGEVLVLPVTLGNDGGQDAVNVQAVLSSVNPHLIPIDERAGAALIASGGQGPLAPPYRVAVSADAAMGEALPIDLAITAGNGYATASGFGLRVGSYFYDDVEADGAWRLSDPNDTATTGRWVRVDPIGSLQNGIPCQTEDDHTAAPGTDCFVTGQGPVGGGAGDADVDGGTTTLISPTFDLTRVLDPRVSYWRWFTNDLGNNPNEDPWVVQISSNGGTSWVDLERTTTSQNSWQLKSFLVSQYVTPTTQVVLRFVATDAGAGGSLVEAAVDDIDITGTTATVSADDLGQAAALRLDPARPNPAVGATTISFAVPAEGRVRLRIYGVDGRLVRTLLDGSRPAGAHRVDWDGRTDAGGPAAPGIYFTKLQAAGDQTLTRRLVLLR